MGKYTIVTSDTAAKQLKKHHKSSDKASIKKIEIIFTELTDTPYEGTGKPEALKNNLKGLWSRRINHQDRIVYSVYEDEVIVYIVSAKYHYKNL